MIEASELADALKTVRPAIPARPHMPVLSGVKLTADGERLTALATSLDLTIETTAPCGSEFECVLPHGPLAAFAGMVDGVVTFSVGDTVVIKAGTARLELRSLPYDEFPEVAHASGDPVKLDAEAVDLLTRVVHAASTEQAKPVQCGVKLGDGQAAATDSYRIAVAEIPGLPDVLVPATMVREAVNTVGDGCEIAGDDRVVTLRSESAAWTARRIEGNYPPLGNHISAESPHHLTVDRNELIDAVGLVAMFKGPGNGAIRLEPVDGDLVVRGVDDDQGQVERAIGCDTDIDFPLAFNFENLTDALKVARSDEVRFELRDGTKLAIIRDGALLLALMPKQVK